MSSLNGIIKVEQISRRFLDLNTLVVLTLEISVLHQTLELILGCSFKSDAKVGNRTVPTSDC